MRIEDAKIIVALGELGVELRRGASLAELTSLGIGGSTDLLRIKKHESIPGLLSLLDSHRVPHRFLGGGSNLLVGDGDLPWIVLQLASPEPDVVLDGNFAQVDAAADLGRMVTYCAKHDLGGMEGLIGVPGTVGGGAVQLDLADVGADLLLRPRGQAVPRRRPPDRNPQGRANFL
jgi:UDP-N-acetylenolpyruvoylglucosamine reductase